MYSARLCNWPLDYTNRAVKVSRGRRQFAARIAAK
jgi:hypothetical protein